MKLPEAQQRAKNHKPNYSESSHRAGKYLIFNLSKLPVFLEYQWHSGKNPEVSCLRAMAELSKVKGFTRKTLKN